MERPQDQATDTRSLLALSSFVALIVLLGICTYLSADRVDIRQNLFAVHSTAAK